MFIPDPGSWILIFTHPKSRISDPGSRKVTKEKGEKNLLSFRIPDPGVKKAPDPGSGSATLGLALSTSNKIDKKIINLVPEHSKSVLVLNLT
jgi:hypothetical protein